MTTSTMASSILVGFQDFQGAVGRGGTMNPPGVIAQNDKQIADGFQENILVIHEQNLVLFRVA